MATRADGPEATSEPYRLFDHPLAFHPGKARLALVEKQVGSPRGVPLASLSCARCGVCAGRAPRR